MSGKLKKGDISIKELYVLSKQLYGNKVDNKSRRARLDITSAKITNVRNFEYNKNEGKWKTIHKRSVKFEFIVRSKPTSYKKSDHVNIHKYPIIFLMNDIESGMDSSFRYRSGSEFKFISAPKGCDKVRRQKIEDQNIKNGIDVGFLMHLEAVLSAYGLLYGRNRAGRLPKITNPTLEVYFEKHSLYVLEHAIMPIMGNPTSLSKIKSKLFKNEDHPNNS